MSAVHPTFWEREPALVVGQIQALIGIMSTAGFAISQDTTGTAVSAASIVATILQTLILRHTVTAPATAAEQSASVSSRLGNAAKVIADSGARAEAIPCPAVPIEPEPQRDPTTGWPLPNPPAAPAAAS